MRKVWGFSYMTFGAILANLVCNAGKAGMAKRRTTKCNKLTKVVGISADVNKVTELWGKPCKTFGVTNSKTNSCQTAKQEKL